MFGWWRRWRRRRLLRRARRGESDFDPQLFEDAVESYACTRTLDEDERARLRDLVVIFLDEKSIEGVQDFVLREDVRYTIAVQACLLVLELGIERYDGWTSIYVYPDTMADPEDNAPHVRERMAIAGVALQGGGVAVSWSDTMHGSADARDGYHPVLHEFAHKLDQQSGASNGAPPMPDDIALIEWSRAFAAAYERFTNKVDRGQRTRMRAYGATNPAEFFAVASEHFFETPKDLRKEMRAVYELLERFYGQDPLARLG